MPEDEVAPALEIGHEWLNTGGYNEVFSAANPFDAHGLSATARMLVGTARVQWTHTFTSETTRRYGRPALMR